MSGAIKKLSQRIDAIDLIRGYFLFVIVIDHLGRNFGFYNLFTGSGYQWVSAAEGFFFVSGMMIGLVRIRKLCDQPIKITQKKVLKRALQLYIWSVALVLIFTLVAQLFIDNPGLKPGAWHDQSWVRMLVSTFTLRYMYGWSDFLNYYAIYLALTPIAVWLLRKGYWKILLLASLAVWAIGNNVQTTWHLLFFSGAIFGYYLHDIEAWFKSRSKRFKQIGATALIGTAVITILVSLSFNSIAPFLRHHPGLPSFGLPLEHMQMLLDNGLADKFNKYRFAFGRLILFYIWFGALYLVVRANEGRIKKVLGWFFVPYGQNSLYVYVVHAFIVFFVDLAIPQGMPIYINILINTAVLATLWLMMRYRVLFKFVPR